MESGDQAGGGDETAADAHADAGVFEGTCEEAARLRNADVAGADRRESRDESAHAAVDAGDDRDGVCAVEDAGDSRDEATEDGGVVAGEVDAAALTLAGMRSELQALETAMRVEMAAEGELVTQIRAWASRPGAMRESHEGSTGGTICMEPPSGGAATRGEEEDLYAMVSSHDGGVYRGCVKRVVIPSQGDGDSGDKEQLVPHGWGVVTSSKGLRQVGMWRDGEQIGVGTLQSAVFGYDGEWRAGDGPSGYGVGTFSFGATFVGCWSHGRPYGLGKLHTQEASAPTTRYGWFYGMRCLQETDMSEEERERLHGQCLRTHLPEAPPLDLQPHRGLFLVGKILEDDRLSALRLSLVQWRRVICDQAVMLAKEARDDALGSWLQAHSAEQLAIQRDTEQCLEAYRTRISAVLGEVDTSREKLKRIQKVRDFHSSRLNDAMFQRDLARRCVVAQEEAIELIEKELADVEELLTEAVQAEVNCSAYSQRLHHVKRQIENASVKINALKCQLHIRGLQATTIETEHESARDDLQIPLTPVHARAFDAPRVGKGLSGVESTPFVCHVPGCSCGIPRDVFLRVGAALNGD